jgi:dTDP-4-dehydrorhamnose 3,5-epimerase-like enzyme
MTSIELKNCWMIDLPVIRDPRGNLTSIEANHTVPFPISRTYYLYDVPAGTERGGHAHKTLQQVLIALSGSFDVIINDRQKKKKVTLNRPYCGLYIGPMVWRELKNFSSGAVCLVLASKHYAEEDYIRDYNQFGANDGKN